MLHLFIVFLIASSLHAKNDIEKKKLSDFSYNRYSQFGEDGIIEKIFEIIGTTSKLCIEFGANDGFSCSNTALLWQQKGWRAVLIETDSQLFAKCLNNTHGYNCLCINTHVGHDEHNSLEFILSKHNIQQPIDLLSIDIDGNDYYIFESLKNIRPRVIICEFNATMPTNVDIHPEYNNNLGCSPGALIKLGKSLGYELVAMTLCNCFFVREELFEKFVDFETSPEKLRDNIFIKFLIYSYDGHSCLVGHTEKTPWYNGKKYTNNIYGDCKIIN